MSRAAERIKALTEDPHIQREAQRLLEVIKVAKGVRECPTLDEVIRDVAVAIAALETHPERECVMNGSLLAVRGPLEGYSLAVWSGTAFIMHMTPYQEADAGFHRT